MVFVASSGAKCRRVRVKQFEEVEIKTKQQLCDEVSTVHGIQYYLVLNLVIAFSRVLKLILVLDIAEYTDVKDLLLHLQVSP